MRETDEIKDDDLNDDKIPLCSSRPSKAKRRRLKTLEKKIFQTRLKKGRGMKNKIYFAEICEIQLEIQVKIRQLHNHWNIRITNEIIFDYAQQPTAAPKTCHDIVWVFCVFSK